jgi:hypothetical protein
MKHVIEHHLDEAQSKRLAERAFEQYKTRYAKYEPKLRWLNDRRAEIGFTAKGVSLKGTVELKPRALEIDLEVPFLFRVFRAPAIKILDQEMKKLLAQGENAPPPSGSSAAAMAPSRGA